MFTIKLLKSVWLVPYAEEGAAVATPPIGDATPPPAGDATPPPIGDATPPPIGEGANKSFTQEQVNNMMKKDREKHQSQTQTALDELDMLKASAEMTTEQRTNLETKIENMRNEMLTKDQQSERAKSKMENDYKIEVATLTTDRDSWQKKHVTSTIERALTDGAVKYKAVSPSQIVKIIGSDARLTEVVDEDGNTKRELVKIKMQDVDKEGKPVELDLNVPDAIKLMTEKVEFQNLFLGEGTGGVGKTTRPAGKSMDVSELIKSDPEAYRKGRRDGTISDDHLR